MQVLAFLVTGARYSPALALTAAFHSSGNHKEFQKITIEKIQRYEKILNKLYPENQLLYDFISKIEN